MRNPCGAYAEGSLACVGVFQGETNYKAGKWGFRFDPPVLRAQANPAPRTRVHKRGRGACREARDDWSQ